MYFSTIYFTVHWHEIGHLSTESTVWTTIDWLLCIMKQNCKHLLHLPEFSQGFHLHHGLVKCHWPVSMRHSHSVPCLKYLGIWKSQLQKTTADKLENLQWVSVKNHTPYGFLLRQVQLELWSMEYQSCGLDVIRERETMQLQLMCYTLSNLSSSQFMRGRTKVIE